MLLSLCRNATGRVATARVFFSNGVRLASRQPFCATGEAIYEILDAASSRVIALWNQGIDC